MSLSVVVCTHDRPRGLERCLDGVCLKSRGGLECTSVVLQPEDRGRGDQFVRVVAHA